MWHVRPFFEKYTNIVNTLKVRGSWGELGNQNTDNWYPFIALLIINKIMAVGWSMA